MGAVARLLATCNATAIATRGLARVHTALCFCARRWRDARLHTRGTSVSVHRVLSKLPSGKRAVVFFGASTAAVPVAGCLLAAHWQWLTVVRTVEHAPPPFQNGQRAMASAANSSAPRVTVELVSDTM